MTALGRYTRRHHVGLLALLLIVTGGVSYAAGALPKNSVMSKQVKNNSLKGKDIKDGKLTGKDLKDASVTGADVADASLTGTDIADGSVGSADLAPGVIPQGARTVFASDPVTGFGTDFFTDTRLGTLGLTCKSSSEYYLAASLKIAALPATLTMRATDDTDGVPTSDVTISESNLMVVGGAGNTAPSGVVVYDNDQARIYLDYIVIMGDDECTLKGLMLIEDK